MNIENGKEIDFIVYEPVRRSDTNLTRVYESTQKTKKYSGLYNRGNTCYLNSLIQILFLTPEFRNNILSWKYDEKIHGKREDCIPFQLQKLFARMKLRCRDSETTEGLTKSFQWDHHQLLEQHDIQELCRVLFEAIEISLSEIEGNFIINLFQGSSISAVKCLKCLKESIKKDFFMDVSLPIRNEFDKIYNTSIEMAFANFLKEEKLTGSEQYFCDNCGEKVDAFKYLKFTKLPKILFIQMNRFEYDLYTEGRKKICDRVTFPIILNMNPFLSIKDLFKGEKLKILEKREELSASITDNEELFKAKISEMTEEYYKEGDNVYELYAVVAHSGSARSGHYYSYIKSYEDSKWYRFEDSSVYEASIKSIENTFGENNTPGATGYILMYRQIKEKKTETETEIKIEENIDLMEIITQENIMFRDEEEKQREKLNSIQLKFIYNDRIANIIIRKTSLLSELKTKIINDGFKLKETDHKNVRIRLINTQTLKMQEAYIDETKTLEELYIVPTKTYTIEIKNENETFEEYDPNIICLNICLWDDKYLDTEEKNLKFDRLKFNSKTNLSELKNLIFEHFDIPSDKEIILFKKVDYATNNYTINYIFQGEDNLSFNSKEFENLNLSENCKLYLEIITDHKTKYECKFVKFFEDNCANIVVKFNMPVNFTNNTEDCSKSISKKVPKITLSSYKFDNLIEIKKFKTLKELKSRIADVLKIPEDIFIIKRNTHNGVELKTLNDTIDKYTTNSINIYVEYGNPQKDSEIKINLFTCEYDFYAFMIYPYKVIDRGVLTVDLNWTVDDLKKNILDSLINKKRLDVGYTNDDFFRLEDFFIRDYKNDRPAKIFQNKMFLGKDLQFVENKKIILQKYIESKIEFPISPNFFQVSVREWDPSNWIVHTPIEIHLSKGATFVEIASVLSTLYSHIEIHNISATKIGNEINLYMDDIRKLRFDNLYENCDYVIENFPFFISTDGFMLLIKDDSKIARDPTEEEMKLVCRPKFVGRSIKIGTKVNCGIHSSSLANGNLSNNGKLSTLNKINGIVSKNKIKEKGVIIKVKKIESNDIDEFNENHLNSLKEQKEEVKTSATKNKNGYNDPENENALTNRQTIHLDIAENYHLSHKNGNILRDENNGGNHNINRIKKNIIIEIETKESNINKISQDSVITEYDEVYYDKRNSESNINHEDMK